MTTINDDCFFHIFKYLPPKDRLNISKVCVRWRGLMREFWKVPTVSIKCDHSIIRYIKEINLRNLQKIMKFHGSAIKVVKLYILTHEIHSNKVIEFGTYKFVLKDLSIADVLRLLSRVTSNVQELEINIGRSIKSSFTADLLQDLLNCNQQLKNFVMHLELEVNIISLTNLPESLEQLTIHAHNLNPLGKDAFCLLLRQISNLKVLKLSGRELVTNAVLQLICAYATQLEVLDLNGLFNANLWAMINISKLKNLKKLVLVGFDLSLTDKVIIEIGLGCQKIEELVICASMKMSNEGIGAMLSSLPELKVLTLRVPKINFLPLHMNLRHLALDMRIRLPYEPICTAVHTMPYLTHLSVTYAFNEIICCAISSAVCRHLNFILQDKANDKIVVCKYNETRSIDELFDQPKLHMVSAITLKSFLVIIENYVKKSFPNHQVLHAFKPVFDLLQLS